MTRPTGIPSPRDGAAPCRGEMVVRDDADATSWRGGRGLNAGRGTGIGLLRTS